MNLHQISEESGPQTAAATQHSAPVPFSFPLELPYLSPASYVWPDRIRGDNEHTPSGTQTESFTSIDTNSQGAQLGWPGVGHLVVETDLPPPSHLDQIAEAEPEEDHCGLLAGDVIDFTPISLSTLAEDYSKAWVRTGLLKIYHDSMEGALSCWLVERNCPYTVSVFDSREAWSVQWSNRIAKRVCTLEEAYFATGALSKAHRRQGSNVLNLVIMAFAAQWAQSGARGTAKLPKHQGSFQHLDSDIFGRDIQERLWHEASQALSAANQNPSFKVIFASIIFSLTQRPIDSLELTNAERQDPLDRLHAILEQDSTSIFLDIALRKLHTHQRNRGKTDAKIRQALSASNEQTFRLLFWLAVMFDTLSAAMNGKSFVVNDHDSSMGEEQVTQCHFDNSDYDLDGLNTSSGDPEDAQSAESTIWGTYFLHELSRDGSQRKRTVRWPCSYEDGASCLADAAPVKVLIFRRVAHLQDLVCYRTASPRAIEEAIDSVFEVYNHWKKTYGLFISDCIAHHESLPPRIQSWYILLAGHWHLAVLIFAELLDKLDAANMGFAPCTSGRQAAATSETLRMHSVEVVSDLGRRSRYTDDELSFAQSPDFHHAVNKAALLTEPWTVVLVRVFGKTAELLVKQLRVQQDLELIMDVEETMKETRSRLQFCLEALWLLGKKSDTAMYAAGVLQEAVR